MLINVGSVQTKNKQVQMHNEIIKLNKLSHLELVKEDTWLQKHLPSDVNATEATDEQ